MSNNQFGGPQQWPGQQPQQPPPQQQPQQWPQQPPQGAPQQWGGQQGGASDSVFNGADGAMPSESGEFIEPGDWELAVTKVVAIQRQKGAPAFVVECRVVSHVPAPPAPGMAPVAPVAPGSERTWMQTTDDKTVAMPNIVGMLAALLGYSLADHKDMITRAISPNASLLGKWAVSPAAPFVGRTIRIRAFMQQSQKKQLWYTKKIVYPGVGVQPIPIEVALNAARAALGAGPPQAPPQQWPGQAPPQAPPQQWPGQAPPQAPPATGAPWGGPQR